MAVAQRCVCVRNGAAERYQVGCWSDVFGNPQRTWAFWPNRAEVSKVGERFGWKGGQIDRNETETRFLGEREFFFVRAREPSRIIEVVICHGELLYGCEIF